MAANVSDSVRCDRTCSRWVPTTAPATAPAERMAATTQSMFPWLGIGEERCGGDRQDGGERRAVRPPLVHPGGDDEPGDDEDAAADAEQAGQEPSGDADDGDREDAGRRWCRRRCGRHGTARAQRERVAPEADAGLLVAADDITEHVEQRTRRRARRRPALVGEGDDPGGSSGTWTTPHRPALNGGTAVAGTIVAPWPSTASVGEQPDAVDLGLAPAAATPTDRAARSSTRRSAEPAGGSSSRWRATSPSDSSPASASGWSDGVDQQQVLGEQRLDGELRVVDGEVDDGGVEATAEEAGDERRRAPLGHDRAHAGVAGVERGEEPGEQPAGRGAEHAEAHVAGDLAVDRGHVGGDVLHLAQDPPGPLDDPLPVVGQPAVGPVDEGRAELPLEAGDVAGDVGLHGEQRLGGGRERAVVGDGDERRSCRTPSSEDDSQHHNVLLARSNRHVRILTST